MESKKITYPVTTCVFTQYNYGESPQEYMESLLKQCDWVMGQLEKCPTTGRPHIQGMAYKKDKSKFGFIKARRERCVAPDESITYCSKLESRLDGPWEFGTRPTWNIKGRKISNMELLKMDPIKALQEDKIRWQDYPKFKLVKQDLQLGLSRQKNVEVGVGVGTVKKEKLGVWVWGEPRTGKSTMARKEGPYIKMPNKWWDGYMGQEQVLLEDVDKTHKEWLGNFLKIWTDWWEFRAEIKGGSILIGPFKKFWITSNYHIRDIWEGDDTLCDALCARFNVIHLCSIGGTRV